MGHVADPELALESAFAFLEAEFDDAIGTVHRSLSGDRALGLGVEREESVVVVACGADLQASKKAEDAALVAHEDEEVAEVVEDETSTITELFDGFDD